MILNHMHGILYDSIGNARYDNVIDYYKSFNSMNIENINTQMVLEFMEQIDYVLEHPEIDLQQYCSTPYANDVLRSWLPIYREHLQFMLEPYEKRDFILTHEAVEVWIENQPE